MDYRKIYRFITSSKDSYENSYLTFVSVSNPDNELYEYEIRIITIYDFRYRVYYFNVEKSANIYEDLTKYYAGSINLEEVKNLFKNKYSINRVYFCSKAIYMIYIKEILNRTVIELNEEKNLSSWLNTVKENLVTLRII